MKVLVSIVMHYPICYMGTVVHFLPILQVRPNAPCQEVCVHRLGSTWLKSASIVMVGKDQKSNILLYLLYPVAGVTLGMVYCLKMFLTSGQIF